MFISLLLLSACRTYLPKPETGSTETGIIGETADTNKDTGETGKDTAETGRDTSETGHETGDTSVPVIDDDGDGYSSVDDCDDSNAEINPGATEICDGVDNDCDGLVDNDDEPVCICEERETTIEFTNGIIGAPVIGDLDGDGPQEIVMNDGGASWWSIDNVQIIVAEYDAAVEIDDRWILVIGDRNYEQTAFTSVIADIDNNGAKDIVDTVGYDILAIDGSGSDLTDWPATSSYENGTQTVIAAYDLDADGNIEIISSGNESLSVFDNTGALMTGWPQAIPSPSAWYDYQPFSIADMNGDGILEIVCAIGDDIKIYDIEGNVLNSIASNTEDVYGYLPGTRSLVGDVNADGDQEIIAAEYDSGSYYMKVYAVDGTAITTFSIQNGALFALADIDGGGDLEIVYREYDSGAYDVLQIYKYDGTALPGWPVTPPTAGMKFYNPIILDINGDGSQEIVVGMGTGYYYTLVASDAAVVIYDNAGTVLDQLEYKAGFSNAIPYLAAGDVDGDGYTDLVAAGFFDGEGSKVRSWECQGTADSTSLAWPMVGHDHYGTYNLTTPID